MLEKMKELIADQLSIDAGTVTEESSFKDDLGVDSLDLATVGDVMRYLKDKGVEES